MKTVKIGELKNQLSSYLQYVRSGEEIIVRDRDVPIARILPIQTNSTNERERQLVASGAMRMPEEKLDWEGFFADVANAGRVPRETAIQAAIDARGDR
jgi:antitoxin (DNA-binding transcriptional repressor) of toxin-antitoxin stability system